MPKRNVFQICSGLLDCKMMPSFVSLFYQEKRKRQNLFCDIKSTIFFAICASMKEKGSTFPYYLNHSLSDRGQLIIRSSASGAPQFAERSTKSQIGIPTIGRISAVQNPQKIIHRS